MKRTALAVSVLLVLQLPVLAGEDPLETRAAFFGLDTTAPGWEQADADGDGIANRVELEQGTDPLSEDTDRDGFSDGKDQSPLSRVYIEWGSPFFTKGDTYRYPAPRWFVGAFQKGGRWKAEEPNGWQADDEAVPRGGRLAIVVNPELADANLAVELELEDEAGSDLRAGLIDGEGAYVAQDLAGNLIGGKDGTKTVAFTAPFADNADSVALVLSRKGGKVTVYRTMLYVDEDGDGLDREQEEQLSSSDHKPDSDGDGLKDYEEVFKYGTDPAINDSDGDGMPDGWETQNKLNPAGKDGEGDNDGDGKSNYQEFRLGRNPNAAPKPDTAGLTRLRVGTPLEAEPGNAK